MTHKEGEHVTMHPQNSLSLQQLVAKALLKLQVLPAFSAWLPSNPCRQLAPMPPHSNATSSHGLEAAAPDVPPRSQREQAGSFLH